MGSWVRLGTIALGLTELCRTQSRREIFFNIGFIMMVLRIFTPIS